MLGCSTKEYFTSESVKVLDGNQDVGLNLKDMGPELKAKESSTASKSPEQPKPQTTSPSLVLQETKSIKEIEFDDKQNEQSASLIPNKGKASNQNSTKKDDEVTNKNQSKMSVLNVPLFPSYSFDVRAPEQFKHPLQFSNKLNFMLGEDEQGFYLYGEGPITKDAYRKFLAYVKHYKNKNIDLDRLMLHSPGGFVNEGLKIGQYIHNHNWSTDADKYMKCYSSCGFIYAAGVSKKIQKGAEVGFHRPYIPNKPDTDDFIRRVYSDYQPYWNLVEGDMGLYNKFMSDYGREEMYILNSENINKYMKSEVY